MTSLRVFNSTCSKAVARGGALGARAAPSQAKKKPLRILDFSVNITILFSLCTSDGYHFTIDKQLM